MGRHGCPGCTRIDGGVWVTARGPTDDGAQDGGEEEGVVPVGEATEGRAHDGGEDAVANPRAAGGLSNPLPGSS